jgi:hypothetical protein
MGDVEAGMVGLLSQRSPQTGKVDALALRQSPLVRRPTVTWDAAARSVSVRNAVILIEGY